MPRDVMFNQGAFGCNDRMAILEHKLVPRRMDRIDELDGGNITENSFVFVDHDGESAKVSLKNVLHPQHVQSDWACNDPQNMSFIKNKPLIGETILSETIVATSSFGGVSVGDIFYAGTPWADLVKKIFTDVASNVNFYWGIVDNVDEPLSIDDLQFYESKKRGDLVDNWWEWPGIYTLDNQYQVIAFNQDARIHCDLLEQEGLLLEYNIEGLRKQETGGWKFYFLSQPSTGKFRCKFHFVEEEKSYKAGMYWGVLDHRPTSIADLEILEEGYSKTGHLFGGYDQFNRNKLLVEGWEWFSPQSDLPDKNEFELDGEWNVIAVSKNMHLICYEYEQGTRIIRLEEDEGFDMEEIGDWKFYYLRSKSTGTFKCTYRFKEGD